MLACGQFLQFCIAWLGSLNAGVGQLESQYLPSAAWHIACAGN